MRAKPRQSYEVVEEIDGVLTVLVPSPPGYGPPARLSYVREHFDVLYEIVEEPS